MHCHCNARSIVLHAAAYGIATNSLWKWHVHVQVTVETILSETTCQPNQGKQIEFPGIISLQIQVTTKDFKSWIHYWTTPLRLSHGPTSTKLMYTLSFKLIPFPRIIAQINSVSDHSNLNTIILFFVILIPFSRSALSAPTPENTPFSACLAHPGYWPDELMPWRSVRRPSVRPQYKKCFFSLISWPILILFVLSDRARWGIQNFYTELWNSLIMLIYANLFKFTKNASFLNWFWFGLLYLVELSLVH